MLELFRARVKVLMQPFLAGGVLILFVLHCRHSLVTTQPAHARASSTGPGPIIRHLEPRRPLAYPRGTSAVEEFPEATEGTSAFL